MDQIFYHLLHPSVAVQPIFLAIVAVIVGVLIGNCYRHKISFFHGKRLPPGSLGLPLFGETIGFLMSQKHDKTREWLDTRIEKYGRIFKTSLMGKPTIVITGSTGNRFVFTADDSTIASNQPMTVSSIMGKFNIFELTGNDHKMIRGAMTSFLKPESLQKYVRKMDTILKQQLFRELEGQDCVKMVPHIEKITFNLTSVVLFGLPIGKGQDSLFEDFSIALKGMWSLPLNFPMTTFHRGMAARRRIYNYFSALIKERRRKLAEGDISLQNDVISAFINLRNENGESLVEDMIIDNIMAMLIASKDTITILLCLLVRLLSRDKTVYKSILAEQERILQEKEGTDGELTWDDVQKMKHTWRVAQELMRITPPVVGNFRRAVKDTSFGGFDIPKGWQVFWVASATHMNENIFPEPGNFDPSRFEGSLKSYPPYTYIPFGAGPRICAGIDFARLEVLLAIHHLVTNFEWSEMIPNEPIIRDPMPIPAMGLPIKLCHKKKLQDINV